jgi:hypothetical protein
MHETVEGKLFTPMEAKQLREKLIRKWILPALEVRFTKFPQLKSAGLLVAQYWCDEASDAVHSLMHYSVLETPDFKAAISLEYDQNDMVNLPNLPSNAGINWCGVEEMIQWDENGIAIPAFAAYCKEGMDQEMTTKEAFSLFAIFRKTDDGIDIEYCGEMLRPWLDGISPEFSDYGGMDEEKAEQIKAKYLETLDA